MAKLIIEAEFDPSKLDWQGENPDSLDMIQAYNLFYKDNPWEAFEIALKDDRFTVVAARIINVE